MRGRLGEKKRKKEKRKENELKRKKNLKKRKTLTCVVKTKHTIEEWPTNYIFLDKLLKNLKKIAFKL